MTAGTAAFREGATMPALAASGLPAGWPSKP